MNRFLVVVAPTLLLFFGAAGCVDEQCVARGAERRFQGSASYDGDVVSGGSSQAVSGSLASSVVVHDYEPHCAYEAMRFTIEIGPACTLSATLEESSYAGRRYAPSTFVGAIAAAEKGQVCSVPVAEGTATIIVETGTLTFGPMSDVSVLLAGPVVAWLGDGARTGRLEWRLFGR